MAMIDNDLICNFKKCRKRLTKLAWKGNETSYENPVSNSTTVEYFFKNMLLDTFCDEDGTREFTKALVCPSCETKLNGVHDVIRHDLQPSEQFKSMILAGLKPEIIMEIASRAMSFWTYQAHQEKLYHEYASEKNKESRDKLENYFQQLVNKLQVELKACKLDLSSKTKELNETKKRLNEISEQNQEKSRQHQKLQIIYDTLRRRTINPAQLDDSHSKPKNPCANQQRIRDSHHFQMPLGSQFLGSTRDIPLMFHQNGLQMFERQEHLSPVHTTECDEVTSHKKAFRSIILRYVTGFKITERCIRLVKITSLTGKSLADVRVDVLSVLKLPLKDLVGKGFGGAANMSRKD